MLCNVKYSNQCLALSKLPRHLQNKHGIHHKTRNISKNRTNICANSEIPPSHQP